MCGINHTLPTGSTSKAVLNDFAKYMYVGKTWTKAEKLAALEHTYKPHRSYKFQFVWNMASAAQLIQCGWKSISG